MNTPSLLRRLLLGALASTAVFAAAAASLPDTSKMNILFIDIEDTYAGAIGCYGNPICRTPNIDRLAATGVRFDSAYCQGTACNATRSSFLTGLRPLTTRVLGNSDVMNEKLPPGTITLPEIMKNRGLYTAVIGKLFHQMEYAERQLATFDRIEHYNRPAGWNGPEPILKFPSDPAAAREKPAPKKGSKEYAAWRKQRSDRYGDSGKTVPLEKDYQMAQTACALLKEFASTKKQFFLAMAQSRPHTPLIAPKKYIDMYDPAKIPDAAAPPESLKNYPYMKRVLGGNPDIFTGQQPTKQQAREAIAAYYACVSFVDDNIGMVLDTLEKTGLDKNTIVVFLGDHGWHLGDHASWSKYSLMEVVSRAALILRVPGAPASGKVCREFVEFVDLMPTLGEMIGCSLPANLEGVSFKPLFANPAQPWKKAIFMVDGDESQMVRNRQYSYLQFTKNNKYTMPDALYDMVKDPWQTVNVANDPAYAQAKTDMSALLKAGWKAGLPDSVAAKP